VTPEKYQRVSEIVYALSTMAEHERADALTRLCGNDEAIRSEVISLLQHHSDAAIALDEPLLSQSMVRRIVPSPGISALSNDSDSTVSREKDEASHDVTLPQWIGRYRILRVIGEGGMGIVYLAEQDRPRRQVALKVIRAGINSRNVLRRFELEQEVLGRLHHPGIAQIFDAGVHDIEGHASQPYFVMEYIDGVTLNEYVRAHGLSTRERLTLFVLVCKAVEHAHSKGVIHRDLKPGNIMVENSGQPKILDFGVARSTNIDRQLTTLQTDIGQLIGTLPYMSPEQVSGDTDPQSFDTRADVYALGVICYELLSGRLPHELNGRTIPEAARIIRDDDPTPLSVINRVFRGDLETIVGKALDRDKTRRYQHASDLGADIERFLRDEPIVARRPSAIYQLQKFARRNRALVGGVIAVFIVLVLGIVGTTWGMVRALDSDRESQMHLAAMTQSHRLADESARRAEAEAEKANQVFDLLADLLGGVDPDLSRGKELTVREMLDDAAVRLRIEVLNTELRAKLLMRVAMLYLKQLGLIEHALELNTDALTSFGQVTTPDETLFITALIQQANILNSLARFEEAEAFAHDSVARARKAQSPALLILALCAMGSIHANKRDEVSAETIFLEAMDVYERAGRNDHRVLSTVLSGLANVYKRTARYDDALEIDERIVSIRRSAYGEVHTTVATAMNNYAVTLQAADRHGDAIELYESVLDIRRTLYGSEHPAVATSLHNLAIASAFQGDVQKAIEYGTESLELRRRLLGKSHPRTLTTAAQLGRRLADMGHHDEAEPLLLETIEAARANPDAFVEFTGTLRYLGWLRYRQGRLDEATTWLSEAIEAYERYGDALLLASTLADLARVELAARNLDAAEQAAQRSIDVRTKLVGPDNTAIATVTLVLARTVELQGDIERAIALQHEALAIHGAVLGNSHHQTGMTMAQLGRTYARTGNCEQAEVLLRESIKLLNPVGAGRASTNASQDALADCLMKMDRFDDAEQLLLLAYESAPLDGARRRSIASRLASLYTQLGKSDASLQWQRTADEFHTESEIVR
jgi:tetratricopeptide (TPR) repeat protein/predicted Ser/Thr protein kinase